MSRRAIHLLLALAVTAALAFAPSAGAAPISVLRDCIDGSLDGSYSDSEKRAALGQIPADLDEYSDCRSVIGASIGGSGGGGDGDGEGDGSGGSSAAGGGATTPEARKAAARRAKRLQEVRRARAREERERKLGARAVDPRDAGVFGGANTANGLPLPLALAVAVLALLALAGGALTLWRRNPDFAGAVQRVIPPRFRR